MRRELGFVLGVLLLAGGCGGRDEGNPGELTGKWVSAIREAEAAKGKVGTVEAYKKYLSSVSDNMKARIGETMPVLSKSGAFAAVAQLEHELGRYSDAVADYGEALAGKGLDADTRYHLAVQRVLAGAGLAIGGSAAMEDATKAAALVAPLVELQKQFPDRFDLDFEIAVVQHVSGQPEAERLHRLMTRVVPTSAETNAHIGVHGSILYMAVKDFTALNQPDVARLAANQLVLFDNTYGTNFQGKGDGYTMGRD